MKKKKVLLIGWDGADWKYLMPLVDKGLMPNLKKLIEGGSMGRLATLDPPLSPTLWTSISTGKRPYKHGIHGFTEPDPSGEGIRPIYITNRKCKAIWNILTQHQLKTHVVGWWPSHPAEPINGTMVSNLYQRATGGLNDPWPMLKGTVHPAEQSYLFAKLRVHPHELTGNHIQPFVEKAEQIDQTQDKRLMSIAKIIADCSSIHSAATYIMENEEWDFMAVYYDAIDHFCHGFMKYHPPRRPHIPMRDYELFHDVVNSGCRYHDMMLGRLMQLAGEDTTIILISDHGFHPDHNRPTTIPKEPAGPAIEHSPYGIIVMNGPGIKKDSSIFGASLLDITPTLLSLYDMPVAEDMDGKVLLQAFEHTPEITSIKSWENINPPANEDGSSASGQHPQNIEIDIEEARAELQQLIELGYIADPGENSDAAVKATVDENNYNLARAYIDGQKWEEGIEILEKLHKENPDTIRFSIRLAHAYQATAKLKDARRVINHIRDNSERESPQLDILEGTLLLGEERYKKALELFQKVEREAGEQANLHLRIANAYLRLNRLDDAEQAILKELKINPEEASAHYILGLIYYNQLRYEEALDAFFDTVGLLYYYPAAHFYIGESLYFLEKYEKALEAYEVCLKLAPSMNAARQRIISIYEHRLGQPGKALKYKVSFEESIKGEMVVVSGLPRSGTSMMMQMLEAGGVEIFTDKARTADENNPKGYYEHEAVKALAKNKKWLPQAKDKGVKVIAQLLKYLPMNYRYKIIFMERDVYEVVQSQQRMLQRDGKKVRTDVLPTNLISAYQKTLRDVKKWAEERPNVEIQYVRYAEIVEQPFMAAMQINDFLGGQLRPEQMVSVIDAKLYRERKTQTTA